MLLIEKALFLKDRGLFQDVPDDALIDVAAALEEVEVLAGERIFEKGELGASMYVLVEGKVRIHDGETELATLTAPDVFGELAALDSEPRSASVTALDECRLFRLDQDALYDLMSERVEVARGVISVLCAKLRAR